MSTNMTSERCGVSPFIRSKVLGHLDGGGGALVSTVHYDFNSYIAEKRRALKAWCGLLARIVAGEETWPSDEEAGADLSGQTGREDDGVSGLAAQSGSPQ